MKQGRRVGGTLVVKTSMALLLGVVACSATTIYTVDQRTGSFGYGSVTGFIETDGILGVLSTYDILDWNLQIGDGNGNTNFDLRGTLSGSNSAFVIGGSDFSATATQLLFNFSAANNGVVLFQAPSEGSGIDFWCLAAEDIDCGDGVSAEAVMTTDLIQSSSLSGTDAIATAAVPEPSTLSFLLLGIAGLMLLKRRDAVERAFILVVRASPLR
jgi:hypothetical protein